jgi:carbon storage regulator CsrA
MSDPVLARKGNLVLSRKAGESVVIGALGSVTVTVLEITRHGKVKLGIEAPVTVPVYRLELLADAARPPA